MLSSIRGMRDGREEGGRVRSSVIAHHLDRAYVLRCELGLPGEEERVLAPPVLRSPSRCPARTPSRPMPDRPRIAALARAIGLCRLTAGDDRVVAIAREAQRVSGNLAFRLGDWEATVDLLEPLSADDSEYAYRVGVALTQAHRGEARAPQLLHGRELLRGSRRRLAER